MDELLMAVVFVGLVVGILLILAARIPAMANVLRSLGNIPGWALALAAGVALVILSIAAESAFPLGVLLAGVLISLAMVWVRDFVYLMSQEDGAFPGRYDKVIWAFLFIVLPPVGLVAFWSYRRAHTAEAKPAGRVEWS